eukprot:scaffold188756_cov37-Tisochrysis_lutea.AAC.1
MSCAVTHIVCSARSCRHAHVRRCDDGLRYSLQFCVHEDNDVVRWVKARPDLTRAAPLTTIYLAAGAGRIPEL